MGQQSSGGKAETTTYGQRSGDARQQPWTGTDTPGAVDTHADDGKSLAEREKPQADGVRSEPDDVVSHSQGRERDRARAAAGDGTLARGDVRQPVDLIGVVSDQPNSADETNSVVGPSDPSVVREDVANTSTSSGLHPEDEASGQKLKEQYRAGAREISRMD